MTGVGWAGIALTLLVVAGVGWPLGAYLERVFTGAPHPLARWFGWLERGLYRLAGVDAGDDQRWQAYAASAIGFGALGVAATYAVARAQAWLPLDDAGLGAVRWDTALGTAVSFVTNTDWQSYAGESTMSTLTQMGALAVQNFLSAATGLAVAVALARGFGRTQAGGVGSFWVDLVRGVLYVLLPLSLALALVLAWLGVVQTLHMRIGFDTVEGARQTLAVGPVASQVAIQQLGTNGGGFHAANLAHPLANPTPLTNLLETAAILVLPVGLCRAFGRMVGDERQGLALVAAMTLLFLPAVAGIYAAEAAGNPVIHAISGAPAAELADNLAGNLEGKEVRFGVAASSLFAAATTAASCGAVDAMHDSFTPLGGAVPLTLILVGEVVFGGVGSGLYGMVLFAVIAVFVAGLMVGRTPEYLGKKIDAVEVRLAAASVLAPSAAVLLGTALSLALAAGRAGIAAPGPHGFTEVLYAWASASNNNGSAFGGLAVDTPFYNLGLAVAMLIGRYVPMVAALALAGSVAAKRTAPASAGTLPTHTGLFVALLAATVVLTGALTHLPALALGPIVDQLQLGVPTGGVR